MYTSKITTKYQVTIPKQVRIFFEEIVPDKSVSFELDKKNQQIILRPASTVEDFKGILGTPPKNAGNFNKKDIQKSLDKERKKEYEKKYGKKTW